MNLLVNGESIADESLDAEIRALATLKRFLVNSRNTRPRVGRVGVCELDRARSLCADERERGEWALLADLILKRREK